MIADFVQRWTERRESRRPIGETIRTSAYDVVECADDATPRAFVERHHYSGSWVAARFRFLLYQRGDLAGVSVFSVGASGAAHRAVWPGLAPDEAVDLGRFVLVDSVPSNGESWFIARCFELLRGRVAGVASCADPVVRVTADGTRVFPGHVGTIYQATNGRYIGRTNPATLRLLPDGRVLSNRSQGKLVRRERGWQRAMLELVRFGAHPLLDGEDAKAWLQRWRAELTRPLRHSGNHRYTWILDDRRRAELTSYGPLREYPKLGMSDIDSRSDAKNRNQRASLSAQSLIVARAEDRSVDHRN